MFTLGQYILLFLITGLLIRIIDTIRLFIYVRGISKMDNINFEEVKREKEK